MSDIHFTITPQSSIHINITPNSIHNLPGGLDKEFQYNNNGAFAGYKDLHITDFANPCQINCSLSRTHLVLITGDTTINLENHIAGSSGLIILYNTTGSHTVPLGTMFTKPLNGSDSYDNTVSKYNLISWCYDGTNVLYSITNEA